MPDITSTFHLPLVPREIGCSFLLNEPHLLHDCLSWHHTEHHSYHGSRQSLALSFRIQPLGFWTQSSHKLFSFFQLPQFCNFESNPLGPRTHYLRFHLLRDHALDSSQSSKPLALLYGPLSKFDCIERTFKGAFPTPKTCLDPPPVSLKSLNTAVIANTEQVNKAIAANTATRPEGSREPGNMDSFRLGMQRAGRTAMLGLQYHWVSSVCKLRQEEAMSLGNTTSSQAHTGSHHMP